MATPWYFRNGEQISKPLQPQELKQAVSQGIITATTQVRQGETGAWFAASQVPGLLDSVPPSVGSGTSNAQQHAGQVLQTRRQKAGLLDIRFTKFLTPTIISILWVIEIIACCLSSVLTLIFMLIFMLSYSLPDFVPVGFKFIFALFIVFIDIIFCAFCLLLCRVFLETLVVLFKIENHLRKN